mgnify:CR=1 FL=1
MKRSGRVFNLHPRKLTRSGPRLSQESAGGSIEEAKHAEREAEENDKLTAFCVKEQLTADTGGRAALSAPLGVLCGCSSGMA